jgi:hypothetical protein
MLKPRLVAPERQLVAGTGLEVGLQSLDQAVVLVADGGVRVGAGEPLRGGFRTWAASIYPAAAQFIDEIAGETARRVLESVSVIVLPGRRDAST